MSPQIIVWLQKIYKKTETHISQDIKYTEIYRLAADPFAIRSSADAALRSLITHPGVKTLNRSLYQCILPGVPDQPKNCKANDHAITIVGTAGTITLNQAELNGYYPFTLYSPYITTKGSPLPQFPLAGFDPITGRPIRFNRLGASCSPEKTDEECPYWAQAFFKPVCSKGLAHECIHAGTLLIKILFKRISETTPSAGPKTEVEAVLAANEPSYFEVTFKDVISLEPEVNMSSDSSSSDQSSISSPGSSTDSTATLSNDSGSSSSAGFALSLDLSMDESSASSASLSLESSSSHSMEIPPFTPPCKDLMSATGPQTSCFPSPFALVFRCLDEDGSLKFPVCTTACFKNKPSCEKVSVCILCPWVGPPYHSKQKVNIIEPTKEICCMDHSACTGVDDGECH